jgi:hypothetical protein
MADGWGLVGAVNNQHFDRNGVQLWGEGGASAIVRNPREGGIKGGRLVREGG